MKIQTIQQMHAGKLSMRNKILQFYLCRSGREGSQIFEYQARYTVYETLAATSDMFLQSGRIFEFKQNMFPIWLSGYFLQQWS